MDQPDQRSGRQGGAGGAATPSSGGRPPRSRPKKPPRRAAILGAVPPEQPVDPVEPDRPEAGGGVADLDVVEHDPAGQQVAPVDDTTVDDGPFDEGGPAVPATPDPVAEPDVVTDGWFDDPDETVTTAPATATYEPYPGATPLDDLDADPDEFDEFGDLGPSTPLFAGPRGRTAALVAGALVIALAGYALGWSRGSAGLDRGSSATTSIVGGDAPDDGATSAPPATEPAPEVDVVALPAVTPTTIAFDDGLPGDLDGRAVDERGTWVSINGAVAPGDPEPLPDGAADPRLMGQGPDVTFDAGLPVSLATVVLAAPTPLSGLVARYQDDGNYWAAVVDPVLTHVTLYEVKDGVQTSKAFVDVPVQAGTSIGMFFVDDQVGLVVDGKSQVLSTFFGPEPTIGSDGIAGNRVGLLTGAGTPAFDDLAFG